MRESEAWDCLKEQNGRNISTRIKKFGLSIKLTAKCWLFWRQKVLVKTIEKVCFDSASKSNETEISIYYHAEFVDEQPSSGVGELQSNDIVNLQDIDAERKRKRPEAWIKHHLPNNSQTGCTDNSGLPNQTRLKYFCASWAQSREEMSEAEYDGIYHVLFWGQLRKNVYIVKYVESI